MEVIISVPETGQKEEVQVKTLAERPSFRFEEFSKWNIKSTECLNCRLVHKEVERAREFPARQLPTNEEFYGAHLGSVIIKCPTQMLPPEATERKHRAFSLAYKLTFPTTDPNYSGWCDGEKVK